MIGKYTIGIIKEVGITNLSDEGIKALNDKDIAIQLTFKSAIPIKYNDSNTSGITFEVVKGMKVLNIDLKSA